MNKRLLKNHRRHVARAKDRVRISEPDVRTPEQLQAAREASRSVGAHGNDPHAFYTARSGHHTGTAVETAAKAEEGSQSEPAPNRKAQPAGAPGSAGSLSL